MSIVSPELPFPGIALVSQELPRHTPIDAGNSRIDQSEGVIERDLHRRRDYREGQGLHHVMGLG
jgi:hypothetical protein